MRISFDITILFCLYSFVFGNGIPSCCPSLNKISQDNECVSNEDNLPKENIREDFIDNCHGQLIPVSSYFTSLTYYKDLVVNGSLVVPSGQFCQGQLVDSNEDIYLVCDTCLDGGCIQTCCPPGQVYAEDQSWQAPRCASEDDATSSAPMICIDNGYDLKQSTFYHSNKTYNLTHNTDYYGQFSCPDDLDEEKAQYSLVATKLFYQHYYLSETGDLIATHPGARHQFDKSKFCLVYLQNNSTGDSTKDLEVTFRYCHKENLQKHGEKFTFIFYPAALLVSSLFLLLTLIAYIVDPDLHRPLFGKITLGFVCNNLIAYLCLAFGYLTDNISLSLNSYSCIILGYLTLYTFTAFMFWINAMAANIFFKFSSILSISNTENDKLKFALYTIYAQGMPLILCIIVAIIEKFGSCDITLPNMGIAQCFLGTPWGEQWAQNNQSRGQWSAFFGTPEFIYFYSVVLALHVANIIFFLLTVYYLVEHWRNAAGIIKSETKGNFIIVIKLFFIMGIPWLGEFISHLITHQHGPEDTFNFRLVIDLLNLLTGVSVFVVLVCKKKTVKRVASRISRGSRSESRNDTRTSVVRDRDTTRDGLLEKESIELCNRSHSRIERDVVSSYMD